ncbi:helix-turn-helix domain-containing protein [Brucella endophytica]|nr:helix-turn-helix transcriptional regulator [Brucella endophytica]
MTPVQCRMARAALGLGVLDLAKLADVSTNTIVRFERGEALKQMTVDHLRSVLEAAGVEFIPENGSGPGVRLAKNTMR